MKQSRLGKIWDGGKVGSIKRCSRFKHIANAGISWLATIYAYTKTENVNALFALSLERENGNLKSDREKTIAQHYLNPKSYMRTDNSEVLKGADWEKRKRELWERSGGRCEYTEPMTAFATEMWRCNREGQIPAHVIPRYPRRNDSLSNLRCYCVEHDRLMERQSWRKTRFGEKAAAGRP